jgi:predicted ATPase/signal transduction histidine kinase/CheY-like chemotaxis protein
MLGVLAGGHAGAEDRFEGRPLLDVLHERKPPIDFVLRMAVDVASRLIDLHARGETHGAVHPGNIAVDPATGEARLADPAAPGAGATGPSMPLPYVSPEQTGRLDRTIDSKTDLYSLGATLYHALCGAPPFQEADPLALIHSHIARPPTPPHDLEPGVFPPLSRIVLKLLAKNAQDRYRSARGLRADLEECARRLRATGSVADFPLGRRDAPEDLEMPERLFGREGECDALMHAFAAAALGSKLLLLVSGPAGVGKSSLVREAQLRVASQRGFFVSGKSEQLQRNVPYSALGQALRELCHRLLAEPEDRLKQWGERLVAQLRPNAQLIVDLVPDLEKVIGKQPPVPQTGPVEAQVRFDLTLRRLVSLFARPEHPLVLFLDDLQWVDPATLTVLQTLMKVDREPSHLLVIGAYRDNEIGASHPLSTALDELRRSGVEIRNVRLAGLSPPDVGLLVAAALHTSPAAARDLAGLVSEKTAGNPLFIDSFLRTLREEKVLVFDAEPGEWRWDIPGIRRLVEELGVGGNVVELVQRKVRREAAATQRALRVAACIGNRFSLSTVAAVTGMTRLDTTAALEPALRERLLVAAHADFDYRFFHDRVQQAALDLTPEAERPALHRDIGRTLVRDTPADQRDERLFDIVDQLDLGLPATSDPDERVELARWNLLAGKKAKAATAYHEAQRYLWAGISLLPEDAWETEYPLAFELHFTCSECEYLAGRFDEANALFDLLLRKARTPLEKVTVCSLRVVLESNRSQYDRALQIGQEALSVLGQSLPRSDSDWAMIAEWRRQLKDKGAEDFAALPELTDETLQATLALIVALAAPTFFTDAKLFEWLILRGVTLGVHHGNTRHSAVLYVMYAMLLVLVDKEFEKGHAVGRLGITLADRFGAADLRSKVLHVFGLFVSHFRDHARKGIELLRLAVQRGLESGDLLFACFAACNIPLTAAMVGDPLADVYHEAEVFHRLVRSCRYHDVATEILSARQLVLCLQGQTATPTSLSSDTVDEGQLVAEFKGFQNRMPLLFYVLTKIQLLYFFGQPQRAWELVEEYDAVFDQVAASTLRVTEFAFYACLVAVENLRHGSGPTAQLRAMLAKKRALLETWAQCAPPNYLHKVLLVGAEVADLEGDAGEAARLYDDAIREARLAGYQQNVALASERAGLAHQRRGHADVAANHLVAAHSAWLQWGALTKARALEHAHPRLLTPPRREDSRDGGATLDLSSVLRATRAMSSEIDLQKLVAQVLQVIVENAGAERGALVMDSRGDLRVEGALDIHSSEPAAPGGAELTGSEHAPEGIVRYVFRTGQSVILGDATEELPYRLDPYVQRRRPRSLLCIPIRHHDRTTGVLFLENSLTAGAFTHERVELLRLLVSQASISLENARLFLALRASEAKLVELLEVLPVGVFVVEPDGALSFINRAAKQIVGRDTYPPILVETFSSDYQLYMQDTDELYPSEKAASVRALRGESSKVDDMEIAVGERRVAIASWGTPVRAPDGSIKYAIVAFQDITAEKQARAERQLLEDRLQQSQRLESIGRLAGGIAHDLNNVLVPITAYAELAMRSLLPTDPVRGYVGEIRKAATHAAEVTQQLLAFGRRQTIETKPLDLNHELCEFERLLRRLIRENITLVLSLAPGAGSILADRLQVQRIVMNLVLNASDAMLEGGTLTVETSHVVLDPDRARMQGGSAGDYCVLRVSDTGHGMSQATMGRVFEPFFTTKELGKGTGLGLATVYGLVKQHSGHVTVRSEVGKGTTFEVFLPRVHDTPTEPALADSETFAPRGRGESILLVEDDGAVRDLVRTVLLAEGYRVTAAATPGEALRQAGRLGGSIDLVVSDVVMPEMNGAELFARLLERWPRLRVLFVSGWADETIAPHGVLEPGVPFMHKPFSIQELGRKVREVLDG